MNTQKIYRTVV